MQHEGPLPGDAAPPGVPDRGFAMDLVEHLVVPTFVLDTAGRIVVWNRACERLTGVPAEAVLGTTEHWRGFYSEKRFSLADLVLQGRFAEIQDHYSNAQKFGLNDFGVSVESWCELPQVGRRVYIAVDVGPVYDRDGNVTAVVETLRDITAQREAQEELAALARLDGLTGLANRRSFDLALREESQRSARAGSPMSLLMIDVDAFKSFNDSYGHGGGDECLKSVAVAVMGVVRRAGDLAARYGGEEFAVILPNTDEGGAFVVAERIRQAVEDLGIEHGASSCAASVTISVGGSTSHGPNPDPIGLMARADAALYRAKKDGRNRTVIDGVSALGDERSPLLNCA